jgi:hypothetical protein
VVEALIAETGFRICNWADTCGMGVLPHYSPGYQNWRLEDQQALFDLVNRTHEIPEFVEILDSGMLRPKKTQLGVFGITKDSHRVPDLRELVPCKYCSLTRCTFRREEYRWSPNESKPSYHDERNPAPAYS